MHLSAGQDGYWHFEAPRSSGINQWPANGEHVKYFTTPPRSPPSLSPSHAVRSARATRPSLIFVTFGTFLKLCMLSKQHIRQPNIYDSYYTQRRRRERERERERQPTHASHMPKTSENLRHDVENCCAKVQHFPSWNNFWKNFPSTKLF